MDFLPFVDFPRSYFPLISTSIHGSLASPWCRGWGVKRRELGTKYVLRIGSGVESDKLNYGAENSLTDM